MTQGTRRTVALLGKVPADMVAALVDDFDLAEEQAVRALNEVQRNAISHGLTSALSGVDPIALGGLPGLTTIASVGAGMDKFDLATLSARGIRVCPTGDVMAEDTAECAVGLVFAMLRNIVSNDRFVRNGNWATARAPLGGRISGRRIGIVGLGRIGGRVAAKLAAIGCAVSYTGRGPKDVPWTFLPDIGALAASVDVLMLTCAGGPATQGIVNAKVLNQLGPRGFLVNVARGSVVVEDALIDALELGRIAGAALDVFEDEPTPNRRFLDLPNCILSPHAAVFTQENRRDLIAEIKRLLTPQNEHARFGSEGRMNGNHG